MKSSNIYKLSLLLITPLLCLACNKKVVIESGDLQIEYNNKLYSRVSSISENTAAFNEVFQLSEYLETKNFRTGKFDLVDSYTNTIQEKYGQGSETIIQGEFQKDDIPISKLISIKTYENYPGLAIFNVSYINLSDKEIQVKKWVNHNYNIIAEKEMPGFWTFQGSSSSERDDWVKPIHPGYYQENFMGMNQSDYGGGIPVSDIWRSDGGIAVGHVELVPREVSLPVDFDKYSGHARIGVEKIINSSLVLEPGDTLHTLETFISVHQGDYYSTLSQFSHYMQDKGMEFAESEEQAFESIWCGWGYERKFTAENIISTLPKVQELGIKWAVIDDGFQIAEGDWRIDKSRFPGGSRDMKKMVDAIHDHGLKAKLWWAPLAADPGSKVIEDYPDILLINEDGAPQFITWWDSYYLSPAAEATFTYTKETIKMFLQEWGFDGLKMDGQHMNGVPPDHNWEREIEYPEKSIEMLPELFKMVYHYAREIKPHAVIENCPCGTCMSFHNMPYTNQTVSSDPTSSWQIRLKGKTYKAIMPHTAYYGDHVELSDNANDFASSFGVGAVLGTKFTWPEDNPTQSESFLLTPEKEKIWKKWFELYHAMMLSKENYLGNLYDIGYDKPETHVISKADTLYYAFYDKAWSGEIEFRGLEEGVNYTIYDYVNGIELGSLHGNEPFIEIEFKDYLLVSVSEK